MAEDPSCPQLCPRGERWQILDVGRFTSGVHCAEAAVVPMGKSPRMVLAMVLGSLRHSQWHHEWALDFDFDVWQRVKEWGLCHQFLVQRVLETDGPAVRPADRQVWLHGGIQEQGVTWEKRAGVSLRDREAPQRTRYLLLLTASQPGGLPAAPGHSGAALSVPSGSISHVISDQSPGMLGSGFHRDSLNAPGQNLSLSRVSYVPSFKTSIPGTPSGS